METRCCVIVLTLWEHFHSETVSEACVKSLQSYWTMEVQDHKDHKRAPTSQNLQILIVWRSRTGVLKVLQCDAVSYWRYRNIISTPPYWIYWIHFQTVEPHSWSPILLHKSNGRGKKAWRTTGWTIEKGMFGILPDLRCNIILTSPRAQSKHGTTVRPANLLLFKAKLMPVTEPTWESEMYLTGWLQGFKRSL